MTSTGKPVYEETAEDADASFGSGRWETAGGCVQSLAFYLHGFGHLPLDLAKLNQWTFDQKTRVLTSTGLTVHDYGCALGDGTALLQACFPLAAVKGFDHSPRAVEMAQQRWRTIDFAVGDIEDPKEDADIIWTSHTLEHLRSPALTVLRLLQRCCWLVAVFPRMTADPGDKTHDGATPTDDWLRLLPSPAVFKDYTLPRKVPKDEFETPVILESNIFCAWRGAL